MNEKSNTPGKILSLLHLGHSVRDREASIGFYSEALSAKSCKTQRSDAPYIGEVNGVKGAVADLAFIEYGDNRPMVELLQFVNPKDIHREYKPGEAAYSHIGFRTNDVNACRDRLIKRGLTPLGEPQTVDYGYAKGRRAILLKDPDNTYVQIVQEENHKEGDGAIIDHDHAVLSVPNIDATIPTFRDLLCCDVEKENVRDSRYLSSVCARPVSEIAVCRSKLEDYTIELWETGDAGGVENIYISASGTIHLCYLCQGIDHLYEQFREKGLRFTNEPVTVTKGVNQDSKAIFFHTPGYLWIELLCRKDQL
jgi:catechol 2,3-dioxygenase-like lactoylglutathione lyase family enzyme